MHPVVPTSQQATTICKHCVEQHVGEVIHLPAIGTWHFLYAGNQGAIVHEYANYHDNAGLRFHSVCSETLNQSFIPYRIMRTIDHIGIPTTEPKAGEVYVEGMKVFLTNYADSTNRIECVAV